jgi:hypothetical protein
MAVALHVAADDGPVEDVERSEQVAARAEAVPPVAAITATWRRTRSAESEMLVQCDGPFDWAKRVAPVLRD